MKLVAFVVFVTLLNLGQSAKILGIFPFAATSHWIIGNALLNNLANDGHDVTLISCHPNKNKPTNGSFRDIVLSGEAERYKKEREDVDLFIMKDFNPVETILFLDGMVPDATEKLLTNPVFKEFYKSGEKFDVVIVEQFLNEAHKYLAHHFGGHLVVSTGVGAGSWINPLVGNPDIPSFVAEQMMGTSNRMNLWERTKNTLFYIFNHLYIHYRQYPRQNAFFKKHFPEAKVDFYDVLYNTSLILINSHVSTWEPAPLLPNMIEIGGFHIQPPKALPKDLQKFLDSAKDGAIYFSMGSNLKSKDLPVKTRNAMIKTFAKLKQKVLWKFEDTDLEMPDNVRIISWAPQQDVLAHPNVKVFITHGGFGGIQETIYNGVPILVIPVFGDQQLNAQKAVNGGYGLKLELNDINEENFMSTLRELIYNKRYSKNAKQRSRIMHDRPRSAKDTATFWVEYVIRHQGAPHLRTAAMDLTWYQYIMLDVLAIIGGSIAVTLLSLYYLFRLCCCRRKSSIKDQTKVKKN